MGRVSRESERGAGGRGCGCVGAGSGAFPWCGRVRGGGERRGAAVFRAVRTWKAWQEEGAFSRPVRGGGWCGRGCGCGVVRAPVLFPGACGCVGVFEKGCGMALFRAARALMAGQEEGAFSQPVRGNADGARLGCCGRRSDVFLAARGPASEQPGCQCRTRVAGTGFGAAGVPARRRSKKRRPRRWRPPWSGG